MPASFGRPAPAGGSPLATDLELAAHADDTTAVHGIADTSVLLTTTTATGLYGRRSPGTRVALLGDSITNQNADIGTNTATRTYGSGYFWWANVLLGGALTLVTNGTSDAEFGTSGQTTGNIAGDTLPSDDLTACAASDAHIVIVHAGTNDVRSDVSAATIAANLQTIWNTLLAAGKTVIATTILPSNYPGDTAARNQTIPDVNRLIRANAARTRGVVLCDWYGAMLDASTGYAGIAYLKTSDYVHPNVVGASRIGKVLADVLRPLVPAVNGAGDVASTTYDQKNLARSYSHMAGTSGTVNSPATGSLATGWTLYVDGSPSSVTASKVARSDVWPGSWQQVTQVANTVGSDGHHLLYQNTNVGTDWSVGDRVRASIEFETDSASWDCRALSLSLQFYNGIGSLTGGEVSGAERSGLTTAIYRPPSGVLWTLETTIPTGTTRLQLTPSFWGTGTIRWGRAQLLINA